MHFSYHWSTWSLKYHKMQHTPISLLLLWMCQLCLWLWSLCHWDVKDCSRCCQYVLSNSYWATSCSLGAGQGKVAVCTLFVKKSWQNILWLLYFYLILVMSVNCSLTLLDNLANQAHTPCQWMFMTKGGGKWPKLSSDSVIHVNPILGFKEIINEKNTFFWKWDEIKPEINNSMFVLRLLSPSVAQCSAAVGLLFYYYKCYSAAF